MCAELTKRDIFMLEEYKSLRSEIDIRIKEGNTLAIYCLTGVASVYGLVFSIMTGQNSTDFLQHNKSAIGFIIWIAVLFPIFGFIKCYELYTVVMKISIYIKSIERRCYDIKIQCPEEGWEHVISNDRINNRTKYFFVALPYYPYWIALLLLTLYVRFSVRI